MSFYKGMQLMQLGEMIAHYHRDHLKPRGLWCGKNAMLFDIMGGGIYKLCCWLIEVRDF